jgi:hypothetical protein
MSKWISVDERMPDEGFTVFAYSKKYDEVYLAYWTGLNWYNEIGTGILHVHSFDVPGGE